MTSASRNAPGIAPRVAQLCPARPYHRTQSTMIFLVKGPALKELLSRSVPLSLAVSRKAAFQVCQTVHPRRQHELSSVRLGSLKPGLMTA
jgi:hypothetical protein